ncbi:outer membrane receptor protein involved in Fe transport [Sphingomonas melonis]|uniref:Outer membrane receptor protein involved in Fe transport n=1 Tax=Sphingomonas melonis TaxID=152682 RepID=A0A7Y9K0S4_9SPHN|nr:outer membrane receptor protein involved in Fe transport [Sphingomonas melonis]
MRVASVITFAALPVAQVQAQRNTLEFRIPAGNMDDALRGYARITGLQILYKPEDVRRLRFAGLDGRLEPAVALERILAGSGLVAQRPARNVVIVRTGRRPAGSDGGGITGEGDGDTEPAIVVTGSNIRGGAATEPVRTLTRRDLERSGRATVSDVLAILPSNFGGSGNPVASLTGADASSLNYSLAPGPNLRGLGADATLTLFDGRRVAGSGGRGDLTDLSAIPSLAVDRVEILANGASAIYGSDAVGGVVNVLLRHRFDGLEVRLRGGLAPGGVGSGIVGLAAGRTWTDGSVFLAYDLERRDALSASDRAYTATGDLRPFGGSDRRSYLSSPGTILSFDPLVGSFLPALRIPTLPAGRRPGPADLTAGTNLSNTLAGVGLSPAMDRQTAYARVEQGIGGGIELHLDGRYSRRTSRYDSPAGQTILIVTPANPNYVPVGNDPFSAIAYSFVDDLGPARARGRVEAFSVSGGATWQSGSGWTFDGYVNVARERSRERVTNQLNSTLLNEALGNVPNLPDTTYDPARDGYFDPYGSGTANGSALLAALASGFTLSSRRSGVTEGVAKVEGPLLSLPGGSLRTAMGASYRNESFSTGGVSFISGTRPAPLSSAGGDRDVGAVFAEVQAPIVGPANAVPGLRSVILSAAARHERYGDFGTTTNPKVGLSIQPAEGVTLRASWGTSFRAPALSETTERRRIVSTSLPDASGAYVPVLVLAGGNPDLGPEKASTFNAGFVLAPGGLAGLSLEVNVFSTRFRQRIAQPALQDLLRALTRADLSAFVQAVSPSTRPADLALVNALLAEPGASPDAFPAASYGAVVDTRFANTSVLAVSGLDYDLNWRRAFGRDELGASLAATWLFRYAERLTGTARLTDRLDTLGNPVNLKLRGGVTWSRGPLSASASGNYVDRYRDDASSPGRAISAFTTIDVTAGYSPTSGPLRDFRFTLAVENLGNASPPFVDRVNGLGFDAANANPFGRIVSFEVRRAW